MNNEFNEQKKKKSILRKAWVQSILSMILIFGALCGFIYWQFTKDTVAIDTAYLSAPIADISPAVPGTLNALYVKENDRVEANAPIALVGSETLYAKEGGIILAAPKVLGSYFSPGQTVVSVIADQKMRVVGTIDEIKGLSKIVPGQRVIFTVDAFPERRYEGVVDEISPASNESGIAFSISDKRPVKKFDVYIRFDVPKYPELKTGMSARVWVQLK